MKLGLLLISMALGYKVFADAAKEQGFMKSLGLFIGVVIIGTSLVGSAYSVYHFAKRKQGHCNFRKDTNEHTFSVQLASPPVEEKK